MKREKWSYPGVVTVVEVGIVGSELLEVAVAGGGAAGAALQPDDQRSLVGFAHAAAGGVVQPPEHVGARAHRRVAPFLLAFAHADAALDWKDEKNMFLHSSVDCRECNFSFINVTKNILTSNI